jgi:dienelactone hydrolase
MRLLPILLLLSLAAAAQTPVDFLDTLRNRRIPALIYPGGDRLAVIGACYGCEKTMYGALAADLVHDGYTVVAMEHEIPGDAPIATTGDIYQQRYPVWERGVKNVQYVIGEMHRQNPVLKSTQPVLIGHSNGGDVAALYATLYPDRVAAVITLDHRRMPIPRQAEPPLLTLRAGEFEADPGVLPTKEEQAIYGIRVERFDEAKHIELSDLGSAAVRERMGAVVVAYLKGR